MLNGLLSIVRFEYHLFSKKKIIVAPTYLYILVLFFSVHKITYIFSTSISEYIDYHLSPEPPVTSTPNLPRILAAVNPLNVTTQLGSPVSLHCVVKNLQDKTVSSPITSHDISPPPHTSHSQDTPSTYITFGI